MIHLPNHFNPTIGVRIFLGFGVVMTLFSGQALVSNLGFDTVVNHFSHYGKTSKEVRDILEIERIVLDLQRAVLGFTHSGYSGVADKVRDLQQVLSRQMATVNRTLTDPIRSDIMRRMEDHFQQYAESFESAVEERRLRDRIALEKLDAIGNKASDLLGEIHEQLRRKGDFGGSMLVGAAQKELLLTQQNALHFMIQPNARLVRENKQRLTRLDESMKPLIEHLERENSRADVERIQLQSGEFEQAFLEMVGATRAYMHLVYVVLASEAAEIARLARELKGLSLHEQSKVETDITDSITHSQWISQGVSLTAILMGFFMAWRITRGTAQPIRDMTRTLTDLARGKKDAEIPGQGRGDEIGAMAMAAHVFKEKAMELEHASQYKSEFLANMSHELRTPLNSLLILARLLSANESGNLTDEQVESARVIHESGADLLRLINDILDLSKVEAGRMDIVVENRTFSDLIQGLQRMFRPIAEQRNLAFETNIHPAIPEALLTDWGKVEQILRNFLSNACKFTHEGNVRLLVEPAGKNRVFMNQNLKPGTTLALTVADTGIGIPEDKREQIFEAFRQADGTTSRKYGGTGLGLSISRKLCDLIGGEIQVTSMEGEGSEFSLFLPMELPRHLQKAVIGQPLDATPLDAAALKRVAGFRDMSRTLLLVDDDPRNLFALKKILSTRVGRILTATNGREALDTLSEAIEVDLVLMDLMMPVMNGYDAILAIRKQPRFANLPIIALTAKAMPEDRDKSLAVGASEFLTKPVREEKLVLALCEQMGDPRPAPSPAAPAILAASDSSLLETRATTDATESEMPQDNPAGPIEKKPITVLIVDDDMKNTFSLTRVLQKRVERVLMAGDGLEALKKLEKDQEVDIILMDLMMPIMDGYAAIQEIRKRPAIQAIPIIALTARTLPEDRKRCLEAGANDLLLKPVELETLLDTIFIHGDPRRNKVIRERAKA
ncbi:MAG: response regulator [Magnetococcales bacterium]|nr:response regulator [Magnetococcales bacterium]